MICREWVLFSDSDGKKWVYCNQRDKRFHLACVPNLPKNVEESDFEDIIYLCDNCGWSMAGTYLTCLIKMFIYCRLTKFEKWTVTIIMT